jgi:glycerate 2-kinase
MSDGGDGFGEVMGEILSASTHSMSTVDAAHRPCQAVWWSSKKGIIIESARVIGLAQLPQGRYHPFELDTFGLGKVLKRAANQFFGPCLVGIGGSATNDGGFGMARALGWKFVDLRGINIERWIDLDRLNSVQPPDSIPGFSRVTVAVDVRNPLLGPRGATRVYGPQKGLQPDDFPRAEACLKRFATVLAEHLGYDFCKEPGTGAAGGLGFGFRAFLSARLEPGFEVFSKLAQLDPHLDWADVVVTGEGCIDRSTLMGKGVGEIATRCFELGVPCYGLAGALDVAKRSKFFSRLASLTQATRREQATKRPAFWLEEVAATVARQSLP